MFALARKPILLNRKIQNIVCDFKGSKSSVNTAWSLKINGEKLDKSRDISNASNKYVSTVADTIQSRLTGLRRDLPI